METKICTKCSKELPITDYYTIKSKTQREYTYSYCKKCHYSKLTKHTAKRWRKDNKKRWYADVKKAQQAMFDRQREGVYLLVTTKGLYIGQTDKYKHRIHQHKHSQFKGNMKHKGAKVLFHYLLEEIYDKQERLEREKFWIDKLRPALNKQFNPSYQKLFHGSYIKKDGSSI